jgi:hypothetical protein
MLETEVLTIYQIKCDICGRAAHHAPCAEIAENNAENDGFVCYTHNDLRVHLCPQHTQERVEGLRQDIAEFSSVLSGNGYCEFSLDALEFAYNELCQIETALKGAL